MTLVMVWVKLPVGSNWFVATGIHCPVARFVEARTRYGQPPAPPVPAMSRLAPAIWIPEINGGVKVITDMVPVVFSVFVFQSSPSASDGRMMLVNPPEKVPTVKILKLSPFVRSPPTLVMLSVPLADNVPEILAALFITGESWTCMYVVLPADSVRLLLIVSRPNGLPGAKPPPLLIFTGLAMNPIPVSGPPATVTVDPKKLPLMTSVPLLTVVAPVWVLVPVSVHVPVPSLMSA